MTSHDPNLFTGMPVLLMSEALSRSEALLPPGICVVPVRFDEDGRVFFSGDTETPPSDVLLAFLGNAAEDTALRTCLSRHGIPLPRIVCNAAPDEMAHAVIGATVGMIAEGVRREALLRQALLGLRQEAEETREALGTLRETLAASLPAQHLVPVLERLPAGEGASLPFAKTFHFILRIPVEVHGLTAVALHVAGAHLQGEDRLGIRLLGEESGRVLGAWDVPAAALPAGPDWLTLDLPLPIETARETVRLDIEGGFSPGSWIALSKALATGTDVSDEAGMVAIRLFTATWPRFVHAPWWNWRVLALPLMPQAATLAEAIPARCWLEAKLLGAARLTKADDGAWRLRLGAGACAALLFPDVPLGDAVAVLAKMSCLSGAGQDVTGAVALIPTAPGMPHDITAAVAAASRWSALRSLGTSPTTLTSPLMPGGAPMAHILLVLRHQGEWAEDFAVLSCPGVLLLPPTATASTVPHDIFAPHAAASAHNVAFEDLQLDESFYSDTYRHLDLSLRRLSDDASAWNHVKFKLFENNGRCGLEFRAAPGWPVIFRAWPGQEEDSFGQIYKIDGAWGLGEAIRTLPDQRDRDLLAALSLVLPHIVQTLATRAVITPTEATAWLEIARRLRRPERLPAL